MPDSFRILIMPQAAEDLADICGYIAQDSPGAAASVAKALLDAIDSLETMPRRNRVHRSHRDPARVVHSMPVPPFIIYYRVLEKRRGVEILTLRHGKRRQPRSF
jgi:plasmid stabilization system protein ParE